MNDLFWVGEEYSSILLYLKYGLIRVVALQEERPLLSGGGIQ